MNALQERIRRVFPPMGFNAGDANLYRFVDNDPTNATDPSGDVLVFANKQEAETFVQKMKGAGATHFFIGQLPNSITANDNRFSYYALTDGRDRNAVFSYANEQFKKVFENKNWGGPLQKDPEWVSLANARTDFIVGSGVLAEQSGLASRVMADGTYIGGQKVGSAAYKAIQQDLLAQRKTDPDGTTYYKPLILDIGGTGPFEFAKGVQRGNADAINWNVVGFQGGKIIPNLLIRTPYDAGLPSTLRQSVRTIIIESTLGIIAADEDVFRKTLAEIVSVIQRGGTVTSVDANDRFGFAGKAQTALYDAIRAKYPGTSAVTSFETQAGVDVRIIRISVPK